MSSWLPEKEDRFMLMCRKWICIFGSEEKATAFRWDNDLWRFTYNVIDVYITADADFREADTTANRIAKNNAKQAASKAMREFANSSIRYNPYMSVADRQEMGLVAPDKVSTPVADPLGQAEASVSYIAHSQLQLHMRHLDGSPVDVKASYGYRIYYGVYTSDQKKPVTGKDLPTSLFTRHKKYLFTFEPEDSSKTAYFAIRYENSKGKAGPWGPMFSAVIP